jgi:hypothetical protein
LAATNPERHAHNRIVFAYRIRVSADKKLEIRQ